MTILIAVKVKSMTKQEDIDRSFERFENMPGPDFGDEIYKLVQDTRHHGMIKAHEKYGELF